MSNKPKGVKIHPANKISNIELAYNIFIYSMIKFAKRFGLSKHIGSKHPRVLKQRLNGRM